MPCLRAEAPYRSARRRTSAVTFCVLVRMQDMTAIARPALVCNSQSGSHDETLRETIAEHCRAADAQLAATFALPEADLPDAAARSEEHTSELQSLMRISYAVFCLTKKTKK